MTREERGRYMASRAWAVLREQVKKRAGGVCERCGLSPIDQVHHLTYERLGNERLEDLQGLCRACHEFESGKADKDPAQKRKPRIYFAGKIRKSGWQSGNTFEPEDQRSNVLIEIENKTHINVGPFTIACDHGCYHGDGKHGVGAGEPVAPHPDEFESHCPLVPEDGGCGGFSRRMSRKEIFEICKSQIAGCDILAALIDADDAYGTCVEIGIAHQMGKHVFVFFDSEERRNKQWFLGKAGVEIVGPRDVEGIVKWWSALPEESANA